MNVCKESFLGYVFDIIIFHHSRSRVSMKVNHSSFRQLRLYASSFLILLPRLISSSERERERERERQGERDRERERERDKEKWTYFFTGTKLVKACHCVEYSVAMKTKFINLETVNFLRSACSVEAFNFRFWSCSLEIGHDLTPYFQSYGSCFNEV